MALDKKSPAPLTVASAGGGPSTSLSLASTSTHGYINPRADRVDELERFLDRYLDAAEHKD